MKVAIVGASGLLGGHLIEQGLKRNLDILAVARHFPQRSGAHFYKDQITLEMINALDLKSSQLKGIDVLINVAAQVSAAQDNSLIDANLNLVKSVFNVAREAGVKKLVHVSSISTMSDGLDQRVVSEKDHGQYRKTPYAESKYQSDLWLEKEFKNLLTIHPCYMLGKWDAKPSSGAILLALQMKRLTGFYPGVKNFVYAGDVAHGIYTALDKNVTGRYILGGENYSTREFLERALKALHLEQQLQLFDNHSLEENPSLKEFFLANPVDDKKARSEWGHDSPTGLNEMLEETVTYFREYKLLPRLKII